MNEELKKWSRLTKRQNEIYHRAAKRAGLPDAQFWLLYALSEEKGPLCQNTFCSDWCYSKQTVSTAVAGLCRAGLAGLQFASGSKKQKDLFLTEAGEDFCRQHIIPVMEAECAVLNRFPKEEREQFFGFLEALLSGISRELEP